MNDRVRPFTVPPVVKTAPQAVRARPSALTFSELIPSMSSASNAAV